MSLWGNKPSTPAPASRPGMPASPASRWSAKPAPQPLTKPDFFKGGGASIKKTRWQMERDARIGKLVVPGTGGKKVTVKQVKDIFKQPSFSYGKVKTNLDRHEAIRILKQMRHEDKGNLQSVQGRTRRMFEQKWGLKSGKDY